MKRRSVRRSPARNRPLPRTTDEHLARFLEGKRRYYEDYLAAHGHHPNKGRHPSTEFKDGNRIWVGRHHSEATKRKLSELLTGRKLPGEVRSAISKGHMGLVPWNKGLTKETTPSLARIGEKKRLWWTDDRKKQLAERNHWFFKEWWRAHPEHEEITARVTRPTRIEILARESLATRGVKFSVCKRVEGICIPDLFLPDEKIAVFCNGCYWHACPKHCPNVPDWLRKRIKDRQIYEELGRRGWKVLAIWEHEFKSNRDIAGERLEEMLREARGE